MARSSLSVEYTDERADFWSERVKMDERKFDSCDERELMVDKVVL
jgi:hypothetical protein